MIPMDVLTAEGVIKEDKHGRLIPDIEHYARGAGIHPQFIYRKAANWCSESELDWLRGLPTMEHTMMGGYYTGYPAGTSIDVRMMAMAGALVRNFIPAKVVTVDEVLEGVKGDVWFLPDFFLEGAALPGWKAQELLQRLHKHFAAMNRAVLYVESMSKMKGAYGAAIHRFVEQHFEQIKVGGAI